MQLAKDGRTAIIVGHIAQVVTAISLAVIAWQMTVGG